MTTEIAGWLETLALAIIANDIDLICEAQDALSALLREPVALPVLVGEPGPELVQP